MKRLPALAVFFALLPTGTARADQISFSYQWSVSPDRAPLTDGNYFGGIRFSPGPSGNSAEGNTSGSPFALQVVGLPRQQNGNLGETPFTLTLRLTDGPSGISHLLTFAGALNTFLQDPHTALVY
jgi:hypothetical protein